MNTIIVSAMFCCGKTHFCRNQTKYSVIDLEDNFFGSGMCTHAQKEWILRKSYCQKLRYCLGQYDFIFVAMYQSVLFYLANHDIPYVLVCPENTTECFEEWGRRNVARGTMALWESCQEHWSETIRLALSDPYAKKVYFLKKDEYLSDVIDRIREECADVW